MKRFQKPNTKTDKPAMSKRRVRLTIVSDKERNDARISAYAHILP